MQTFNLYGRAKLTIAAARLVRIGFDRRIMVIASGGLRIDGVDPEVWKSFAFQIKAALFTPGDRPENADLILTWATVQEVLELLQLQKLGSVFVVSMIRFGY